MKKDTIKEQITPRDKEEAQRMIKYIDVKSFETDISIRYRSSNNIELSVEYVMGRDFEQKYFERFSETLEQQGYFFESKVMDTDFPINQEKWRVTKTYGSVEEFNESSYAQEYKLEMHKCATRMEHGKFVDATLGFGIAESTYRKNVVVRLYGAKKFVIMENFSLLTDIHNGETFIEHHYDRFHNRASTFFETRSYKDDTKLDVETAATVTLTLALGLTSLGIFIFLKKHPELAKQIRDGITKNSTLTTPVFPKNLDFVKKINNKMSKIKFPV